MVTTGSRRGQTRHSVVQTLVLGGLIAA